MGHGVGWMLVCFWQLNLSATQRGNQLTDTYKYTLIFNKEERKGLSDLERGFANEPLVRAGGRKHWEGGGRRVITKRYSVAWAGGGDDNVLEWAVVRPTQT